MILARLNQIKAPKTLERFHLIEPFQHRSQFSPYLPAMWEDEIWMVKPPIIPIINMLITLYHVDVQTFVTLAWPWKQIGGEKNEKSDLLDSNYWYSKRWCGMDEYIHYVCKREKRRKWEKIEGWLERKFWMVEMSKSLLQWGENYIFIVLWLGLPQGLMVVVDDIVKY